MDIRRWLFLLLFLAAIVPTFACGGGAPNAPGPTAPSNSGSGTTGGGGACRTYATTQTLVTTSASASLTSTVTQAFNSSTNELTWNQTRPAPSASTQVCSTLVFTHPTRADFVGVGGWPVLPRASKLVAMAAAACGGGGATSTYSYDSQGRLNQIAVVGTNGFADTVIYSDWDSLGRPRRTSSSEGMSILAYDDASRTITTTAMSLAGAVTGVTSVVHDADGIIVSQTHTTLGQPSTTTYVTGGRDRVCN